MTIPSHLVCFAVSRVTIVVNMSVAAVKGQYIKQTGLAGFAMYEAGGDYEGMLIQSITQAMA